MTLLEHLFGFRILHTLWVSIHCVQSHIQTNCRENFSCRRQTQHLDYIDCRSSCDVCLCSWNSNLLLSAETHFLKVFPVYTMCGFLPHKTGLYLTMLRLSLDVLYASCVRFLPFQLSFASTFDPFISIDIFCVQKILVS